MVVDDGTIPMLIDLLESSSNQSNHDDDECCASLGKTCHRGIRPALRIGGGEWRDSHWAGARNEVACLN
jgi:hypothetical protein